VTDTPRRPVQELDVGLLLTYRRQIVELHRAEQQRLSRAITESAHQESTIRLGQFSRLLTQVDNELTSLLQVPLRPRERKGWCRKTFRE
jgi:hypothetical protein